MTRTIDSRPLPLILALLLAALSPFTLTAEKTREEKAVEAAREWLQLVDAGEYEKSWKEAAAYFRGAVPRERWAQTIRGVREPLGETLEREVESRRYVTELPGAPDGEYVVIVFATRFAAKARAIETVTPMLDPDGTWRVSGYFIK